MFIDTSNNGFHHAIVSGVAGATVLKFGPTWLPSLGSLAPKQAFYFAMTAAVIADLAIDRMPRTPSQNERSIFKAACFLVGGLVTTVAFRYFTPIASSSAIALTLTAYAVSRVFITIRNPIRAS